jgi:guanylate cyclase, other
VERVKRPKLDGEEVFRPDTSSLEDIAEDYVVACMRDCWAEDPNLRPDFPTIRTRLKKLKSGKSVLFFSLFTYFTYNYTMNASCGVRDRTKEYHLSLSSLYIVKGD